MFNIIADVMPSWKSILLKAAGFGAGLGATFFLLVAILWWWSERPQPQRPWDRKAVTARYEDLSVTTGDPITANFTYSIKNNTDQDYKLNEKSVHLMLRDFSNTLEPRGIWVPTENVMIPAHHAVKYSFSLTMTDIFDSVERKKIGDAVVLNEIELKLSKINGFILFDDEKRYEIELPNGWKNIGSVLRTKSKIPSTSVDDDLDFVPDTPQPNAPRNQH